jgi:hypothetical protein
MAQDARGRTRRVCTPQAETPRNAPRVRGRIRCQLATNRPWVRRSGTRWVTATKTMQGWIGIVVTDGIVSRSSSSGPRWHGGAGHRSCARAARVREGQSSSWTGGAWSRTRPGCGGAAWRDSRFLPSPCWAKRQVWGVWRSCTRTPGCEQLREWADSVLPDVRAERLASWDRSAGSGRRRCRGRARSRPA